MATGTFYLRPSADISLGHPVYPDTLTAGYLAINEEVSDGAATYIGYYDISETVSGTSKFTMSLTDKCEITSVLSAKFIYNGETNGYYTEGNATECICSCTVSILGESIFTGEEIGGAGGDFDTLTNADMSELVSALNNYISVNGVGKIPEITIEISNSIKYGSYKSGAPDSYVTQIGIELECEYTSDIGIYHKVNGSWVAATAAYQKVNGAWTEITADECKSILQGNLIGK